MKARRSYLDQRVKRYDQQRQYHILRHEHLDPDKNRAEQAKEERQKIHAINKAKAGSLRFESSWDIISHQEKVPSHLRAQTLPSTGAARSNKAHRSTYAGYNIISNQGFRAHAGGEIIEQINPPVASSSRCAGKQDHLYTEAREFNIISNKYFTDHEQRAQAEQQTAKADAQLNLQKSNIFNPVQARFYDGKAEQAYSCISDIAARAHADDSLRSTADCIKQSEGFAYDIINLEPRQPHLLRRLEKNRRSSGAKQAKQMVELRMKTQSLDQERLRATRALHRVADERFRLEAKRGYDILSHLPFKSTTPAGNRGADSPWAHILADSAACRSSSESR